jgi:hypothetical protein
MADVTISVEEVDRAGDEADRVVEAFLDQDRERGIDLGDQPPMRLTSLRFADRRLFVWTLHHLVIDGWSQVGATYRDISAAVTPSVPRFREFVRWLADRDAAAAESFWRARLGGGTEADVVAGLSSSPSCSDAAWT